MERWSVFVTVLVLVGVLNCAPLLADDCAVPDCPQQGKSKIRTLALTPPRVVELIEAVKDKRLDLARDILSKAENVNHQGNFGETALIWAAYNGDNDLVALLLSKGALVNQASNGRFTPLYWAAKRGHGDVVKTLLDAGAKTDVKTKKGETPEAAATKGGHKDIVELLRSTAGSEKGEKKKKQ
ncbi:ankyrin repeat domain-containing protein [Thermodesulfobacteriota bacterium]